jgi:hypothetical protein
MNKYVEIFFEAFAVTVGVCAGGLTLYLVLVGALAVGKSAGL